LAKDIHEASNLLALHRPVHDIGQQVSHYYLYRLINPETAKPLDAAQFKEPPAAERVLRQAIHRHRHLLNPHDQPLQTNISHFLTAISRDLAIPLDLLAAQFHKGGVDAVMKYYEITTERTHEEIATFIQHKGVPPEALSAYLNGGIQELKAPNPLVAYALCSLTGDTKSLREIEAEWGLSTQDFLHQAYLSSLQEPKTAATARQELQILRQKVTAYQIAKTDALKGEIRSFDKRLPPVLRAYYLHLKGPNPNTPDVLLSKIDTLLGLIPS
jgi:hypothetical protein